LNPVLLITGGGRGIGAATALLAARRGYAVAVNYASNSLAADEVVRTIRAGGGTAIAVQADVGDEAPGARDVREGRRQARPPHRLVNNAGVVDVQARVDEMSVARLERMFRINVIGSFLCAREAVRRMSTKHGGAGGAIVNISSGAARLGSPGQYVDYAASKAPSTPSPSAWPRKWPTKASASTRCAPASSTPRSTPPAACPTAPPSSRPPCR
jgi:NAD(P)-dependent dehydrogenase (short-subunit alcohol dehydrogenase family)